MVSFVFSVEKVSFAAAAAAAFQHRADVAACERAGERRCACVRAASVSCSAESARDGGL